MAVAERDTRLRILAAARALPDAGYASLSTQGIAEAAGAPAACRRAGTR